MTEERDSHSLTKYSSFTLVVITTQVDDRYLGCKIHHSSFRTDSVNYALTEVFISV